MRYFLDSNGKTISLYLSDNFISRLVGLFSVKAAQHEGVILKPCNSVHTILFFRRIDVIFVSSDGRILKVVKSMGPNRISVCYAASYVVELFSGAYELDFKVGDNVGEMIGEGTDAF